MVSVANKIKFLVSDLIKDKKSLIKILSIAVILMLALVLRIHSSNESNITVEARSDTSDKSETSESSDTYSGDEVFVDIGGAVLRPGVYKVNNGTRLYEVIELAGGLRSDADTDSVNQAAFVEDGAKIIIPVAVIPDEASGDINAEGYASAPVQTSSGLININTADKDRLKTLSGIGDVIADRIIEYRSANRFSKKEDIMKVNGIGDAIFEKIKEDITV